MGMAKLGTDRPNIAIDMFGVGPNEMKTHYQHQKLTLLSMAINPLRYAPYGS